MDKRKKVKKTRTYRFSLMLSVIVLATLVGYLFKGLGFPEANIIMVYLLGIQIVAWLTDNMPTGIMASIVSTLAFNYFFTSPYFTLSVNDSSYIVTFVIMAVTSMITSALTSIANKNAFIAQHREIETRSLYQLTNQLTDADSISKISAIVVKTLSDYLEENVGMLCYDDFGEPEHTFIQQKSPEEQVRREVDSPEKLKAKIEQMDTAFVINGTYIEWPIYGRESILGLIRFPNTTGKPFNETHQKFIHATLESTAVAMERIKVTEQRAKGREETLQERYRSTLLRSISHDLRTPLSSIMGTSEMLLNMNPMDTNQDTHVLVSAIYKDAKWLYALVENVLSLTRLEEGKLVIGKSPEVVEELISSVIERFSANAYQREIEVLAPDEAITVPMDAKLIEQVLLNLLDNAYKHTTAEDEICISVAVEQDAKIVRFRISDSGSGITDRDLPHVLELFYTANTQKKNSLGLGLPICDAIVRAHGGTLSIMNRLDRRGVDVSFTLPLEEERDE